MQVFVNNKNIIASKIKNI